ncbi:ABC transporter ATP-binding protein [Roseateles koreensis]|uniref:ABC transporter ATP-binding protein n=1 Tax=Roseateles koreensis TaxID=2987526 RepID=A0ABT5KN61_9BURK|nr:ABC transporter ATP-binding protein [Roseateles koreensis]MDC8784350.1 ABC transporter ATP-binding protein [Roseateles koreensis]
MNEVLPMQLQVQQARVNLGGRPVLRDVDVSIPQGQVLALLGGSGCGKTTLLRAIAGLQALHGGHIHMGGRDISRVPAQERGMGVVFQNYALFPNLSVLENIKFGVLADGHGQTEATSRANELLQLVELQAQATKVPAQLSGGQRQRVALARALARKPSLLLMDEPFSALDESFRVPLRRSFRHLQRALGQSCLLVTHDREEAFELADQVAVMFDGRIEQCSPPLTLWRRPQTRRVAEFLGAFNLLDARHAPGVLYRDRGHWISPIAMLTWVPQAASPQGEAQPPSGEAAGDAGDWLLRAQVQACFIGQQRVAIELVNAQGGILTLWADHQSALPEPGRWLDLRVRLADLQYLAE